MKLPGEMCDEAKRNSANTATHAPKPLQLKVGVVRVQRAGVKGQVLGTLLNPDLVHMWFLFLVY